MGLVRLAVYDLSIGQASTKFARMARLQVDASNSEAVASEVELSNVE
jgi:hypothetical protein